MLKKVTRCIHIAEDGVLLILVSYMLVLSLAQILLRNLGINSIVWADPSVRITVLWLAFFGAMRASRQQNHISIDIITHYGKGMFRKTAHFITSIFSATVCATAAYYTFLFVKLEMDDNIQAFGNIPAWLCEMIIPLGLAIIALRFLIHSLHIPEKRDDYT